MVRRKNLNREQHRRPLGRSKSTSDIPHNPVQDLRSIDPTIAQRDAHIAAVLSYCRGQNMSGNAHGPPGFITERTSSRRAFDRHGFSSNQSEIGLKRQQSVRFTGPQARTKPRFEPRMCETGTLASFSYGRLSATGTSERRRTNSTFSDTYTILRDSPGERRSLAYSIKCHTPDHDENCVESPYGRLHKSKSMFAPSTITTLSHAHGATVVQPQLIRGPSRYAALNRENEPLPKSESVALRAPKSMSFLRDRRTNVSSRHSGCVEIESTLPFASQQTQLQLRSTSRISSRPSLFFRSKPKRSDSTMVLRKSMRDSSINTGLSSTFSGDNLHVPKQGSSLRSTARKVSKSFKNKIKEFFGRKSSATESFVQDTSLPDIENESVCRVDIPVVREATSLSRGPSRLASLHAVPSNQQLRSRQGSLERVVGNDSPVDEENSRVTSWTDSVTNTVGSQLGSGDVESHHLHVINEKVVPASSGHYGGSDVNSSSLRSPVDSQRIYSALMRRADEARAQDKEGRQQNLDEFRGFGKPPVRTSSVDQVGTTEWSPPTIRCVEDDDVFQGPCIEPRADPPEPRNSVRGSSGSSSSAPRASTAKSSVSSKQGSGRARPKSNRNAVFFASPSNHLFRTTSPFRRVLQENMRDSQEHGVQSPEIEPRYMGSLSAITLPSRRPSNSTSERDEQSKYADSTYSSSLNDDQQDFGRKTSLLADRFPEPPRSHVREATAIEESPNGKKNEWIYNREVSTASSIEWKKSLSANISKQEDGNARGNTVETPPWMSGHIRENAEIESPADGSQTPGQVKTPKRHKYLQRAANSPRPHFLPKSTSMSLGKRDSPDGFPFPQDFAGFYSSPGSWRDNLRPAPSLPYIKADEAKGERWGYGEAVPLSVSMGTINSLESSRRDELTKRRRARARLAKESPTANRSPRLTTAVGKQFGKLRGKGQQMNWNRIEVQPSPSTIWATTGLREKATVENRLPKPSPAPAPPGSKQMVDTFLNSRKRGIIGSQLSTEGDSESSPAAFL